MQVSLLELFCSTTCFFFNITLELTLELFCYSTCFFFQYNVGVALELFCYSTCFFFNIMLELILELFCSNTCFFFQYNVKGYTRVVLLQHVFSRYNRSIYWSNFTTARAFFNTLILALFCLQKNGFFNIMLNLAVKLFCYNTCYFNTML